MGQAQAAPPAAAAANAAGSGSQKAEVARLKLELSQEQARRTDDQWSSAQSHRVAEKKNADLSTELKSALKLLKQLGHVMPNDGDAQDAGAGGAGAGSVAAAAAAYESTVVFAPRLLDDKDRQDLVDLVECSICKMPMNEPINLSTCNHRFCG